jgi:hypothetical protein
MVATDVASRGIGMIETPLPCTATPSRLHSSALLSTLRRFVDCVILPGFFRVFWFSIKGCLGSMMQHDCATFVIPNSKYFSGYKMWNWHFLTCSSCLQDSQTRGPGCVDHLPWHLTRNGQSMSDAERVLDAFKCSFFTSRPGTLLYNFSCSC